MYSRNIPFPMVCFQSKRVKYVGFKRYFDFYQLLYVFEEIF